MANEDGETTGLEALFEAAKRTAAAVNGGHVLLATDGTTAEPGVLTFCRPDDWTRETVDLEAYAPAPRRKVGHPTFDRAASLVQYVNAHKGDGTAIYARGQSFVAVLNGHAPADPGWGDHVATFALQPTDAWKAWTAADKAWMEQAEFAEFLEDRLPDIAEPAGGALMDIATSLRVKTAINFQSSVKLANGQVQLTYDEDINAGAGQKGDMAIPEKLLLVIQPFEGTEKEMIEARFRWRIASGKARFHYALGEAITRVTRHVLEVVGAEIEKGTTLPVLYGAP